MLFLLLASTCVWCITTQQHLNFEWIQTQYNNVTNGVNLLLERIDY